MDVRDPNKIIKGIQEKNRLLSQKNDEYIELGEAKAQAERDHDIALAGKILALKMDGHPVTLIKDLAKGDKVVAELQYKFNVAEGVMKACMKSMDAAVTAIDSYRSILTWEREEKHRT